MHLVVGWWYSVVGLGSHSVFMFSQWLMRGNVVYMWFIRKPYVVTLVPYVYTYLDVEVICHVAGNFHEDIKFCYPQLVKISSAVFLCQEEIFASFTFWNLLVIFNSWMESI